MERKNEKQTKGNFMKSINFKHFDPPFDHHEDLAQHLVSGYKLNSVIVVSDLLDSVYEKNPKFAKIENHIICSIVEEDARREMTNGYRNIDEVEKLLTLWDINFKAGNNSTEEEDRKFKSNLIDLAFKAETIALYPDIIEKYKYRLKHVYNEETDEETEITDEEVEKLWPDELLRILAPQTQESWERIYSMPEPFNYWDSRNAWQQTFFIQPLIDTSLTYFCRGGSAGSSQRETQGLMAHTFAYLVSKGIDIETKIYKYTSSNAFILEREYNSFKVMDVELSGNYQVDLRKTKHLFDGLLLSLNYEKRTLEEIDKLDLDHLY